MNTYQTNRKNVLLTQVVTCVSAAVIITTHYYPLLYYITLLGIHKTTQQT